MAKWSKWSKFPDPRKNEYLNAPFGPGVYDLRHISDKRPILFGKGGNVAHRMSSLLPTPYGCGNRNNAEKRQYVLDNIENIEYRTLACNNSNEATSIENELRENPQYMFKT